MIFAVLDVSLIMGLNIGETDKVFYINLSIKRQVWCSLQWQPCVIHTWAPWGEVSLKALYKYVYIYLYL